MDEAFNYKYIYAADGLTIFDAAISAGLNEDEHFINIFIGWRPSLHMPKDAARLFLRVVDVREERLQDITISDCIKEGVIDINHAKSGHDEFHIGRYSAFWDSQYEKKGFSWESNPKVEVCEFKIITGGI